MKTNAEDSVDLRRKVHPSNKFFHRIHWIPNKKIIGYGESD